jgi:hypothetical protein
MFSTHRVRRRGNNAKAENNTPKCDYNVVGRAKGKRGGSDRC